jgi:RNA polymerase sigma-70 factor (ECF subfamily)
VQPLIVKKLEWDCPVCPETVVKERAMGASAPGEHSSGNIEELLGGARAGSSEALGELLEHCRQYLLLVANRQLDARLRGKVGPSDLVQEALLDAQRDFERFAGRSQEELLAWLRRILLNNLANVTRQYRTTGKRQVDREVPLEQLSVVPPAKQDSPSTEAIARERAEALERALGRLPEAAREVIQWRNYDRCSFEEIGRRLGRSAEAARKVWVRALEQLQSFLGPADESS